MSPEARQRLGNRDRWGAAFLRNNRLPSGAQKPIHELAPAKVNLTLEVLGKRPDGFHELSSLVTFADFGDRFSLTPGEAWGLSCSGPMAGAISGANIVDLAAKALRQLWPQARLGHGELYKVLPVFAGIGGGSADAAAALRALRRLNAQIPGSVAIDWAGLARSLGADVPVCLVSQLSLMQGIGERIQTLARRHALPAVLVNPGVALSTAAVFAELAAAPLLAYDGTSPFREPATTAQLRQLILASRNDLEAPAFRLAPVIGEVCAALTATQGCTLTRMSGSGPTCFGIYDTPTAAAAAAHQLSRQWPDWWVRATILS